MHVGDQARATGKDHTFLPLRFTQCLGAVPVHGHFAAEKLCFAAAAFASAAAMRKGYARVKRCFEHTQTASLYRCGPLVDMD